MLWRFLLSGAFYDGIKQVSKSQAKTSKIFVEAVYRCTLFCCGAEIAHDGFAEPYHFLGFNVCRVGRRTVYADISSSFWAVVSNISHCPLKNSTSFRDFYPVQPVSRSIRAILQIVLCYKIFVKVPWPVLIWWAICDIFIFTDRSGTRHCRKWRVLYRRFTAMTGREEKSW